jgi:hypothetical protein
VKFDPQIYATSEITVSSRSNVTWVADFEVPEEFKEQVAALGRNVVRTQYLPRVGDWVPYGGCLWVVSGVMHWAYPYGHRGARNLVELKLEFAGILKDGI